MKKKSKFLRIFIYFCIVCYIGLTGFLIYQASLDGDKSSQQSGAVGDELTGIINGGAADQTVLIEPTGLSIENEIFEAKVGSTHKLVCKTLPEDASYKSLVYQSSDSKIASISSKGVISFLKEGEVKITVSNKDYPSISESFEISISKIALLEYSISIKDGKETLIANDGVYQLKQYETYEIDNVFNPKDASIQKVSYTYDKEYLTISNDKITTKKPTSQPLEIKTSCDGINNSFKISIEEVIIEVVDLQDYKINSPTIKMNVNESISLSKNPFEIQFIPSSATDTQVSYVSKNEEIAKIEKGKIIALSAGIVEIEIESHDNAIKKVTKIEVSNIIALDEEKPFDIKQEYLQFDQDSNTYHFRNGISATIECNFTSSSTYKEVTYKSSDESILLVGEDGTINPIKKGNATITITIDDRFASPLVYEINVVVEKTPFIEDLKEFYYLVRKSIGHFGAFLVLGIFGTFAFLLVLDKKKWCISIPLNIVLGFSIAALTEYIQTFVPGRYGCWEDIWLDFAGFMTSASMLTIIILVVYLIKHIKTKKKEI